MIARLLVLPPLLATSLLTACAAEEDPELVTAAVDRGYRVLYAGGPNNGDQYNLPDEMGQLILVSRYDSTWNQGYAQFRIYTNDHGIWTEVHLQALCTDGNWIEVLQEDFVDPAHWMFADVTCPSPYSVSEAWASVRLDY